MPRIIDAEQFYKELAELYQDIGWDERDNHISLADIKCNLELMPTVDPVRHGHWEYVGGNLYRCSVCHKGLPDDDNILTGQENYCGVCGAKMDERKNGQ
jgi:DNA-directed RNA polymerase subunit RPC12/RpoP